MDLMANTMTRDSVHGVAAVTAPPAGDIKFAVFSGHNAAAAHLLEVVQLTSSPPTLKKEGEIIGYQLSIPPLSRSSSNRYKWRIGAGTSLALKEKNLSSVEPEILLSPPLGSPSATMARKVIKDLHASLYFHPHSGALLFRTRASNPICYENGMNGHNLILSTSREKNTFVECVLWQEKNYLWFGDYCFVLELFIKDEDVDKFQQRLDKNLKCRYYNLPPSKLLSPIPRPNPETSGKIWLHQPIPKTNLRAGIDIRTGQPVAVEKLANKREAREYVNNRFQLARQHRDKHNKSNLVFIDVWCECETSTPCHSGKCPYIYHSVPLAAYDFQDIPWDDLEVNARPSYLYQTLLGLVELHQKHTTHGCILPDSLLVLGNTETKLSSAKGNTVPGKAGLSLSLQLKKFHESICAAPELRGNRKNLDRTKVDIWALAASWLFAYTKPPKNTNITEKEYGGLRATLDDRLRRGIINEPLFKLFQNMLAWDPEKRPSAKDALTDKAWESILEEKRVVEENNKRKRREEIQHHRSKVNTTKKVKVLSPHNDY